MGVVADIRRSLAGDLRSVVRAHLDRGPQEARSFAFLMLGCGLVFLGQWPRLAREALERGQELERLVAYALVAWLMVWPLVFYGVAGVAHGVSRALGGRGTIGGARLALFWSWLAASPFALLAGLGAGLTGSDAVANLAGVAWLAAFAYLWSRSQREAATGTGAGPPAHA